MDTSKNAPVHVIEYFGRIHTAKSREELQTYVDTLISMHDSTNPIYLSDCLVNLHKGGQHIMIALEGIALDQNDWPREDRMTWRIQVLCDEYGNKPEPGQIIYRKQLKKLKQNDGLPIPCSVMTMAKIDGTYEERFIKKTPYKVDNKGCIQCCFSDAVHFLHSYGVHGRTDISMTTKPETMEVSDDKVIHYWRYKEINNEMYKALPKLTKKTKDNDNEKMV